MAKLGDQVCKKMITKKTKPTKKPTPYLPDLEELHLIIFIFLISFLLEICPIWGEVIAITQPS